MVRLRGQLGRERVHMLNQKLEVVWMIKGSEFTHDKLRSLLKREVNPLQNLVRFLAQCNLVLETR